MTSEVDMRRECFPLNMTIVTKGICDVLRRECPDANTAAPIVNVSLEAVQLGRTVRPGTSFCKIVIADSYKTGNHLPAMEHIGALPSFFGFPPDGVRWYLDSLCTKWIWEDSAEYRSRRATT
ncbi:hypothetical protein BJ165DRAFT_232698 [Panaeolus papilionaceus]|nr:hypothetical protein BJ165DRAFT_232698 [Panaeolus papilionaceus]